MQYVHSMQDRRHLLNSENLHIFRMFAGHKNPNKCTQSIFFLVTPYAVFKLVNDPIGFNGKKLLSSLPFSCESKNYRFTSLKTYRISNMPNANPNACHRCRCCFFFCFFCVPLNTIVDEAYFLLHFYSFYSHSIVHSLLYVYVCSDFGHASCYQTDCNMIFFLHAK